jgi:RNA recognition motif-containing protein
MAQKLFVGGIAFSTTSDGLREFFSQAGSVLSATVVTDRVSGQSRGFGFVEMETSEATDRAITQLNGRELDGRKLTVQVSNPPTRAGARGPGAGGRRGGWR